MSVDFNGSNAKLQLGPTTLTGLSYPISIFCWLLPDTTNTNYMVAGLGQNAGSREAMIYAEGAGSGKVRAFTRTPSLGPNSTTSVAASWLPALAVFTSDTSRTIYYGAGAAVTDTTALDSGLIAALDRVVVGVRGQDETLWYSGLVAHFAIWSGGTALGQTQFDALAGGAVPSTVSNSTLWDYWALASNAATHTGVNGRVLTSFGGTTTGASDPPVGSAPALSSPTVVSTGNTIATVRVTTDTAPSGSSTLAVQVLPAATATPTAAAILASPTQTITSGVSGARDFNLTALTNGTAYRAHFAQTGPSNVVSTASFTPSTVPGAPTIGTAVAGNASATVNGTAPASNGGATITGYRSTATPGGSTVTGASLPITHTGLTNGTAYTFTLAAQNANGYGAESAASNSVTPSAGSPPPPPPPPPPPGSATLTLTGFKQWTGTAWTSITVPFVKVCRASTGAVVLEVSSAAVNASGNMTITSGSLTAGVVYVVFGFNTDGTLSFKKTATAA